MCWLRDFDGAVWYSSSDQSSGAVICKPYDQVAQLGKFTYAASRIWKILRDLPIPP